jgi:hypothetical protein
MFRRRKSVAGFQDDVTRIAVQRQPDRAFNAANLDARRVRQAVDGVVRQLQVFRH